MYLREIAKDREPDSALWLEQSSQSERWTWVRECLPSQATVLCVGMAQARESQQSLPGHHMTPENIDTVTGKARRGCCKID